MQYRITNWHIPVDGVEYYPDFKHWFAVIEMKKWLSSGGVSEMPGIMSDVDDKLRVTTNAAHSMMVIFSANPTEKTNDNVIYLAQKIDLTDYHYYSFPTINRKGETVEFWIAGYQVK